jgi:hypothetical protein
MMIEALITIEHQDFSEFLNQNLTIRSSENMTIDTQIIQVSVYETNARFERIPFSVVLRAQKDSARLNQGVYIIEHPIKGDLALFLVPIGDDNEGIKYEITFS